MHRDIQWINLLSKPNFENTLKRKLWCILSKEFTISNLILSFITPFLDGMYCFLNQNNIVKVFSLKDKSYVFWNNFWKEKFEPYNQDLGNDFVRYTVE